MITNTKTGLFSQLYAYALIAIVGYLLFQYFLPVLKLSGLVPKTTEGMTNYQEYEGEKNNPMFLAQKNASNIAYLKEQITSFSQLQEKINEISTKVDENSKNITQLVEAQTKKADAISSSAKKNLQ
jgi:uncharacterized protein (DUF342 family)